MQFHGQNVTKHLELISPCSHSCTEFPSSQLIQQFFLTFPSQLSLHKCLRGPEIHPANFLCNYIQASNNTRVLYTRNDIPSYLFTIEILHCGAVKIFMQAVQLVFIYDVIKFLFYFYLRFVVRYFFMLFSFLRESMEEKCLYKYLFCLFLLKF